jgi:regulator of sigma E protease
MLDVSLLAAFDLLWWIDVVLKVSIGLGAVIFVHELGHFLVAKACGVKCEKFMIGFDIGGYKISRKWGETEYGIGILPLGGYVKMLGQDDDPAHIAEQMQKSQVAATSANAVEVVGPSGEKYFVDRRSYLAKSVPQRMAIISAGVIMNIIFAFIFAVIAYGMGVPYWPCVVSETIPGSPAWREGLEPGDEIVQIGDRTNPTFLQLKGGVSLGDPEQGINVKVRRAANNKVVPLTLRPKQAKGELATIGIGAPQSLTLLEYQQVIENSPAARATLVAPAADTLKKDEAKFRAGDAIVRIGDIAVANYREFAAALAKQPENSLRVTVKRSVDTETASPSEQQELTFEVPAQELKGFGLVMKMGPITAVRENSPAAAAGLAVGDIVDTVDGQPAGAEGGWTPDTLPDLMRQAAVAGREVELVVARPTKNAESPERVTIRVTPRVPIMFYFSVPFGMPQGVEALGIAYGIENEVLAVSPDGPAADTEIKPGDKLVSATIKYPKDNKEGEPEKPIELGAGKSNWPRLVDLVQFVPHGTAVEFTLAGPDQETERKVELTPAATGGVFEPARGFIFEPIERIRTAASFADQVREGWYETVDSLTMVVRFLQKLGTQVPFNMLGGPGTIAAAAGGAASEGLPSLLIFLTMLSANLAVINFLPIPLLDGGHMVFLAYEGIRGRPANEKVVVALHTLGFVFIISLMLYVIGLDIQRWIL